MLFHFINSISTVIITVPSCRGGESLRRDKQHASSPSDGTAPITQIGFKQAGSYIPTTSSLSQYAGSRLMQRCHEDRLPILLRRHHDEPQSFTSHACLLVGGFSQCPGGFLKPRSNFMVVHMPFRGVVLWCGSARLRQISQSRLSSRCSAWSNRGRNAEARNNHPTAPR